MRGATRLRRSRRDPRHGISTHAPLAGRDKTAYVSASYIKISTHAPLAGRDGVNTDDLAHSSISTHAPLAGRDQRRRCGRGHRRYFNPRAPCGARPVEEYEPRAEVVFQPTRPLRGATRLAPDLLDAEGISTHAPLAGRDAAPGRLIPTVEVFQPTRPLRGATMVDRDFIRAVILFQPTRPLRGATVLVQARAAMRTRFQPTRPLRGATAKVYKSLCTFLR